MRDLTVVIAQSDSHTAQEIASRLHEHFRRVAVARDVDELRNAIPKNRADIVVLDLELAGLGELKTLHDSFNHTRFVCTHRVPDDDLWTQAVNAGAEDVCYSDDVGSIVHAAAGCRFGAGAAA